jgi:general secretion pathway protein I
MTRRGFSLVEVLVALSIFTLAAIVLGASYVNVLNAYSRVGEAAQQDEDLRFARQALFLEPELEKVEEGGDFQTTDGRRVVWRAVVEPTNVADLFAVTFTCELGATSAGARAETVVQTFRLLRPTWSKPEEREKLRQEARDRIVRYQENLR